MEGGFDMYKYMETCDLIGQSEETCPITVKIADLGLARKIEEDDMIVTMAGSPL